MTLKLLVKTILIYILPKKINRLAKDILKQKRNFLALASHYGQFRTIREWSCVDNMGHPIPWYTYPAIEYLSHIDFSNLKVMEYGSGNSSLWWMERCRQLVSIENDKKWFEKIKKSLPGRPNVTYILETTPETYVNRENLSDADIVIIDGVFRSQCADALISAFQEKPFEVAMLIFDNSDWYPKTINKLQRSLKWIQVDFHGFGPINDYTSTTSIFINHQYAHKLVHGKSLRSIKWIDNATENLKDAPQP